MAKKRVNNATSERDRERGVQTIVLTEPYRLYTVLAERALIPHEAIDQRYFELWCKSPADWEAWRDAQFIINNGTIVRIKFIAVWRNDDNRFGAELDKWCRKLYNMPFSNVSATWASRLRGFVPNYWHLIEMEEVK